jgi:hypothetical protein
MNLFKSVNAKFVSLEDKVVDSVKDFLSNLNPFKKKKRELEPLDVQPLEDPLAPLPEDCLDDSFTVDAPETIGDLIRSQMENRDSS